MSDDEDFSVHEEYEDDIPGVDPAEGGMGELAGVVCTFFGGDLDTLAIEVDPATYEFGIFIAREFGATSEQTYERVSDTLTFLFTGTEPVEEYDNDL